MIYAIHAALHELMNGIVEIAETERQFPAEGLERLAALKNWALDRIARAGVL